ncbi:MAG: ABC transporter permease [Candidatus Syntrophonatronum acetioxidans]|uniref:ABC transporter permease n=1 Tax=Candidatus Syntrophonatronum acetioxidans TaxID=1795816 RepID=A0A424YHC5_9FIRM|nr:MAG: ABC transporter permease [Candidatus Syntrophonatronum acetioxidans]
MHKLLFLAYNDIKRFAVDPGSLFLALIFPLVLVFLVVNVYPAEDQGIDTLTLGMVSLEEEGEISQELISFLEGDEIIPVVKLDFEGALQKMEEGEIEAFLLFPEEFSKKFYQNEKGEIKVYASPENLTGRMAALEIARGLANQVTYAQRSLELIERYEGVEAREMMERFKARGDYRVLPGSWHDARLNIHSAGPPVDENRINWALPAFFTMFVFLASSLGAVGLVEERERLILERMVLGGISRGTVLGARFLSGFLKGLLQVIVLWGAGIIIFDLYTGHSFSALMVISLLFVGAASAFSLWVASISASSSFAFSLGIISSLTMASLGGCWWPVYLMPSWMGFLGRFTPHWWANSAFSNLLLTGGDLASIRVEALILLLFIFIFSFWAHQKSRGRFV